MLFRPYSIPFQSHPFGATCCCFEAKPSTRAISVVNMCTWKGGRWRCRCYRRKVFIFRRHVKFLIIFIQHLAAKLQTNSGRFWFYTCTWRVCSVFADCRMCGPISGEHNIHKNTKNIEWDHAIHTKMRICWSSASVNIWLQVGSALCGYVPPIHSYNKLKMLCLSFMARNKIIFGEERNIYLC